MSTLDELLEQAEEKIEKGEELDSVEAEHHGKVKERAKKESVEDKIKKERMNKNADDEVTVESDADESKEADEADENENEEKPKKSQAKTSKSKVRSKNYQKSAELVDRNKKYQLEEAIALVKKSSMTKFDGNVEAHIRVLGKSGKPENLRGLISYPNSTGKKVSVVILSEEIIDEIAKTGKIEADLYLAKPELMPKVARLAKILGPKGKMPNPKSGTVTADPEKTKKDMEGGQVEYKTDSYGIVHQVIGKVSATEKALLENYKILLDVLPKEKIVSITLTATMGPGVKVAK